MNFHGVYSVLVTPFDPAGELDESSLRRQVRFCHDCGVHGLVAPVNASEFFTLSDDERKRVVEVVAEENAGKVPFIAGCSALSAHHGVMLARHAERAGADAVMAMPPAIRKAAGEEIYAYYAALAEAVPLPLVIQDFIAPIGTPMPAELLARLLTEIPNVRFLKEETVLGPHVITRVRELCGGAVEGIMGGQGGRALFNEVARGACGTMPASHLSDVQVDIWNLIAAGSLIEARALFNRMLPMLNFEHMYSIAVYKETLKRRGVIATTVSRGAPTLLDAHDLGELDILLGALDPDFRVRYG
jgi:dihydrodipicolinate synthase/N-acetylneuraminate lyase